VDDVQLRGEGEGDSRWRALSDRARVSCIRPAIRRARGADRRGCASAQRRGGVVRGAAEAADLRALVDGVHRRALDVTRELRGCGVSQRIPAVQETRRHPHLARPGLRPRSTTFQEVSLRALS
jgi:hypothetical protein